MENASKALIIAGAILLSILIISLGIIVYNQAKGTIGNVNLSEEEVAAFNQKFSMYEGGNVSGANVNALIEAVISSNIAESRNSSGKYVEITFKNTASKNCKIEVPTSGDKANKVVYTEDTTVTTTPTINSKVYTGKTYNVVMEKDGSSALIYKITVTVNS